MYILGINRMTVWYDFLQQFKDMRQEVTWEKPHCDSVDVLISPLPFGVVD